MAIIQSGATADLWTINPVSNAGRVTLYDSLGNELYGIGTIKNINNVLDALNEEVLLTLSGQANTSVQLWGSTGTFTVSFQANIDGINWFSVLGKPLSGGVEVSSATGDGVWFIDTSGYKQVRARVTSYTSGSTTCSMIADPEQRIDVGSTTVVLGTGSDNTTNSTSKVPVLAARANISAPSWTDGYMVPLSVDAGGALRITGTISATSASVSATGSSPPASATYIGGSVTTSAPSYTNGTMNALSLTTGGLLRVDGSAVTQPISGTVAVTQSTSPWVTNVTQFGSSAVVTGTGVSGAGIPRVTVSNDSNVIVSQATASNLNATVVQSTAANLRSQTASESATGVATPATAGLSGGAVTTAAPTYTTGNLGALSLTTSGLLRIDGSGVTQPISAASLPLPTGAATETTLGGVLTTTAFQARINTLGQKTMANSTPVVLASDQTVIPVSQSGTWTNTVTQATAANLNATVVGTGSDNTTNSTAKIPVLPARANTSAPSFTDGNMVPLSTDTSGNLRVTGSITTNKSTTGTITSVVGSTSNTSVLASNTSRISATVYNDSNKTMYLALAATASTSSYTIQIARDSYWELPVVYTGAISAVWASGVSGNALVTELT